ncbi:hypothetical protein RND81_05G086100 [Saponaria officinalis]|uniref:Uncharacterized protein n=1 Tax=Saponaria officinalis TaxID=3572 RepID=A0AAW1KRK9_SAPOF
MSLISRVGQETNPKTDEAASIAMCMASWQVPCMVFKTVLELNVLDIIQNVGPTAQLSPTEIVAKLPTSNPDGPVDLDRMLRLLASFDLLTCSVRDGPNGRVERLYGLGPVCQFLVSNDDEGSYSAFADLMHDKIIMDTWKQLKGARNGHHSTIVLKEILDNYKAFEGLSSLVDVGGATGVTLNMIVQKYPTIKGINFDLPHIIKNAPTFEGVENVEGDMYVSVPSAEAIFMKWTVFTGNDEKCGKLLRNCYKASPKKGKVIFCEYVVPDLPVHTPSAHTSFIFDTLTMTFAGGKARTKEEYEALGKAAGFKGFHVVSYACDTWVMEFLKEA